MSGLGVQRIPGFENPGSPKQLSLTALDWGEKRKVGVERLLGGGGGCLRFVTSN